jgi:gliding motility-associated lipoprotein GldH
MKNPGLLIILLLPLCLLSCDNSIVFEDNKPVSQTAWNFQQPVQFEFDITDTVRLHNFYVNVRNLESYNYSNVCLFVSLEFPNGKLSVDTIDCPLADQHGHWLGSGIGDLYSHTIIYKEKKKFPMSGHYKIAIQHAMRTDNIEGLSDVGFKLTSVN